MKKHILKSILVLSLTVASVNAMEGQEKNDAYFRGKYTPQNKTLDASDLYDLWNLYEGKKPNFINMGEWANKINSKALTFSDQKKKEESAPKTTILQGNESIEERTLRLQKAQNSDAMLRNKDNVLLDATALANAGQVQTQKELFENKQPLVEQEVPQVQQQSESLPVIVQPDTADDVLLGITEDPKAANVQTKTDLSADKSATKPGNLPKQVSDEALMAQKQYLSKKHADIQSIFLKTFYDKLNFLGDGIKAIEDKPDADNQKIEHIKAILNEYFLLDDESEKMNSLKAELNEVKTTTEALTPKVAPLYQLIGSHEKMIVRKEAFKSSIMKTIEQIEKSALSDKQKVAAIITEIDKYRITE